MIDIIQDESIEPGVLGVVMRMGPKTTTLEEIRCNPYDYAAVVRYQREQDEYMADANLIFLSEVRKRMDAQA